MKKLLFLFASISLILSACLPAFGGKTNTNTQPQIDIQGTAAAAASTIAAQTLSPLSTPELFIPITDTLSPSETPMIVTLTGTTTPGALTDAKGLTTTPTPTVNLPSGSGTPGLTEISITLTSLAATTPTPDVTASGPTITRTTTTTPTQTVEAQTYGTLPPFVAWGTIVLVNKSKADVDVSLQVLLANGSTSVLEFNGVKTVKTKAPAGKYFFVAFVGGKEMTGSFRLSKGGDARLTFYAKSIDVVAN